MGKVLLPPVNIVKVLSNCHYQEFMAGSSKGNATGF